MTRSPSDRWTAADWTSCGVSGPREAVRAKIDRPEAWTGTPRRCAIVGFAVSASTRRVGAMRARIVAMPVARVVRPGAPLVPHTAMTVPGDEGGGGGGGCSSAMAGWTRTLRVAAISELTTCSGLPGAATDATPMDTSLGLSACEPRATTATPHERSASTASAVRSGSAPSMTARSAIPARPAAITSARSAQRRTIARVSPWRCIAWMRGASYRCWARMTTPWTVLMAHRRARQRGHPLSSGRPAGRVARRSPPGSRCAFPSSFGTRRRPRSCART